MTPHTIEVLNQEIDCDDRDLAYYRILVDRKYFKYITIEPGIYDIDDLCFPPVLLQLLPPFPEGDWNFGHIAKTKERPTPQFIETSKKTFPAISNRWHPKSYDFLSLKFEQRLKSNVHVVSLPEFEQPVIAKFARFEWEVGYYVAETKAYSWIEGHNIGPEFLGYLTEEGRAMGFLIEKVEGHHASISDISACTTIVNRLHSLGISHGDLNKHNFMVSEGRAVLIDFETATRTDDMEAMRRELEGLEQQLLDKSGKGGVIPDEDEDEDNS